MKYPGPHRSQVGRALETFSPSALYIAWTPFSSLCFFSRFFSGFADFAAGAASVAAAGFASSFFAGSSFLGAGLAAGIMQSPL
jgi:hypothetical protein